MKQVTDTFHEDPSVFLDTVSALLAKCLSDRQYPQKEP